MKREIIEVSVDSVEGAVGYDFYRTVHQIAWTDKRPRLYGLRYRIADGLESLAAWLRPAYYRPRQPEDLSHGTVFVKVASVRDQPEVPA